MGDRAWSVGGHVYCDGCFSCEESPCLDGAEKAGAVRVEADGSYCVCCGRDIGAKGEDQ